MPAPRNIEALIAQACTAPSSHNTQPWRFEVCGATITLWADRTRALPVNDPFDRELTISCGAALFSLRAAAAAQGLATTLQLLPDGPAADCLAHLQLADHAGAVTDADAALAPLAQALALRRTYRKAFAASPVTDEDTLALAQAAASEGAALLPLDASQRQRAAELVAEGDRLQWDDPRWRRELAMWMHPRRSGDGLTLPALAAPIAQAVVRSFDLGDGTAARDQQLAAGSPSLTVLGTTGDDALAWLCTGQALQRALLTGCRRGLQASYLNQPLQCASLRPRLQALTDASLHPQLLIRWGHPGVELPATPRRPMSAVLAFREC